MGRSDRLCLARCNRPEASSAGQSSCASRSTRRQADWDTPAALKEMYGNASIVGDNRVIFNIKGNDYRLVVKITPVCLANAVADAVGIDDVELPMTPPKVASWRAGEEPPPPE